MKDLFQEIFLTIRANKMRTFLTGFSISWGIFMLIILLGAGNGLQNGMMEGFRYMSKNSISLYPGFTSMPYNGMQKGRRIRFSQSDIEFLRRNLTNVSAFSPIYNKWSSNIVNGKEVVSSTMSGVEPDYQVLRSLEITAGRFINLADNRQNRKVVVIHPKTAEVLFRNQNPIGQYVEIDHVPFQVIGLYDEDGAARRSPSFYIPLNTAQIIFNPSGYIDDVSFVVEGIENKEQSTDFSNKLRRMLSQRLQFDPNDQNAIWIQDRLSDYMQAQTIFNCIALFVWIIGIGTLIAGVVGVSNIMLITVKERTHEFGVRKALGASPRSILHLVVWESLTITTIFGYIGMVVGVLLTEGLASILAKNAAAATDEPHIFLNPTVDLTVVLAATAILVVAGVVAGYVPAKRAVNVKPIEALQHK